MKKLIVILIGLMATGVAAAQTEQQKNSDSTKAVQKPPLNPTEAYSEGRIPDTTGTTTRIGVKKSAAEKAGDKAQATATSGGTGNVARKAKK